MADTKYNYKIGDIVYIGSDWSGDGINHYAEVTAEVPKGGRRITVHLLDKPIAGKRNWNCDAALVKRLVSSG